MIYCQLYFTIFCRGGASIYLISFLFRDYVSDLVDTMGTEMQTVSLSFYRFATPLSRLWALTMMGAARLSLPRIDGIQFWKLCGSGTGEGFTPIPNTSVYAILTVWPDLERARTALGSEGIFQRYRAKASEHWTLFLNPYSARVRGRGAIPSSKNRPRNPAPLPPSPAQPFALASPRNSGNVCRESAM